MNCTGEGYGLRSMVEWGVGAAWKVNMTNLVD